MVLPLGLSAAASALLGQGIDLAVASMRAVRDGIMSPETGIASRAAGLTQHDVRQLGALVRAELDAGSLFQRTKPGDNWDVGGLPLNSALRDKFGPTDRVVFATEIGFTNLDDLSTTYRTITVTAPYGIGHDELTMLLFAEAERRAGSPGFLPPGQKIKDNVILSTDEVFAIVRTF